MKNRNVALLTAILTIGPMLVHGFTTHSLSTFRAPTSSLSVVTVPHQSNNNKQAASDAQQQQQQQDDDTNNVATPKSWADDGFVYGLEGSGLERPKGKVAVTVVDGDSLETKPYQVGIVTATLAGHAGFCLTSLASMLAVNGGNVVWTAIQAILLTLSSWFLADFGSGVLHWSVDNYGNGRTPIMGGIIAAFQGHHSAPWTITQRGFCNNVYKLCLPFGMLPMALISVVTGGPFTTFFWTTFCVFEILSQEFHKWAHMLPSETPAWVNTLQKVGLTVSRKAHAQHHLEPFDDNYSIISGATNNVLDQTGFFRRLEHAIYQWNGVESNAWKLDPILRQRTLAGDYQPPSSSESSSST